jgi:hypothetical protein
MDASSAEMLLRCYVFFLLCALIYTLCRPTLPAGLDRSRARSGVIDSIESAARRLAFVSPSVT